MASEKIHIPDSEIENLARAFLPDIIAFFESEEGKKEYKEWLEQNGETKEDE